MALGEPNNGYQWNMSRLFWVSVVFSCVSFVSNSGHNYFGILKQYVSFLEFSIEFDLPSAEAGSFSN